MQMKVQKWGNGSGVRFTKEFLRSAGVSLGDSLNAEVVNGQIVLTPQFRQLNLSEEMAREEPAGNEVW